MARSGYPGTGKHTQVHRELVNQVQDLVEKHRKGTLTMTMPVMDFLQDWLQRHIQSEDFRLAEFLKGK